MHVIDIPASASPALDLLSQKHTHHQIWEQKIEGLSLGAASTSRPVAQILNGPQPPHLTLSPTTHTTATRCVLTKTPSLARESTLARYDF